MSCAICGAPDADLFCSDADACTGRVVNWRPAGLLQPPGERTIGDDLRERLELRGITPEQVLADPRANLEYCQIVTEICDDLMRQRGHEPA